MSDAWWYVTVGYTTVIGSIATFAWFTIRRGRRLSRDVPEEDRRWM